MTKLLLFLGLIALLPAQLKGQGFATTATNWVLPMGGYVADGTDYGFNVENSLYAGIYAGASEEVGSQSWVVLDINGDTKPDLVVFAQRVASGELATFGTAPNRYWKAYLGTGTGFATTATTWSLPAGGYVSNGTTYGFNAQDYSAASVAASDAGSQSWSVLDVNGDARPDLVVLAEKQTGGNFLPFGMTPSRYWKVYLNTGTGFAATALNWALPTGGRVDASGGATTDYGFNQLAFAPTTTDATGSQSWSVRDINGDVKPDLVVLTENQAASGTSLPFGTAPNRYWKVYLGTGAGFAATALSWALPTGGRLASSGGATTDYGFDQLTASPVSSDAVGSQTWAVLDVNSDAKLDLVVLSERKADGNSFPFGTTSGPYWKVYLNTGNSFVTAVMNWALPPGGMKLDFGTVTNYSFWGLVSSQTGYDAIGNQTWAVSDINGDSKPDLIVFTERQASGTTLPFGTAPGRYWKVYAGTSGGFATTATNWTLPSGGHLYTSGGVSTDAGFDWRGYLGYFFDDIGSQSWLTLDIDGDAKPDLVVFTELQANRKFLPFGTAPGRYWKVYLNTSQPLATTPASLAAGVSLYPNPANGQLTLRNSNSLAGQLGAAEPTLDIQALPAGVYGVRVGQDGHFLRFVKQ